MIRALSGLVFVSVLIFCILFNKISFLGLFYILMIVCIYEFKQIIRLKSIFPYLIGTLLFIFGNILNVEQHGIKMLIEYVGVVLFLTLFITFVSILFTKKEEIIAHLGKIFITIIYIVVPFTLIVQIPFLNTYSSVSLPIRQLKDFLVVWFLPLLLE
jgi:phosphatidate cytidylyltransferase